MIESVTLYNIITAIYIVLFLLFARLFYFRFYSQRMYWKREPKLTLEKVKSIAKNTKQELPTLSVMIPARNESAVITKTLEHIVSLNYPINKYEVIVVTDEKELISNAKDRSLCINTILSYLKGDTNNTPSANSERLLYALISYLLIQERYSNIPKNLKLWLSPTEQSYQDSEYKEAALLTEIVFLVSSSKWIFNRAEIVRCIKRYYPGINKSALNELYSRYLALCLPIMETVARLKGKFHTRHYREELIARITRVRRQLTREIIIELTNAASDGIGSSLYHIQHHNQLNTILNNLYTELFPTTQQEIKKWAANRKSDFPKVVHKIVPANFNGLYKGQNLPKEVPSTKGRALNYALTSINPESVMCGFYDAESRPNKNILLHVAWRCLKDGADNRILQGPIFQVRNFYSMRPISRIASLYQSATHNWALPVTLNRIPFVGGTNVYISCDLLTKLRGYDHNSLTEDLEIGTRAWLDFEVWPEFLPCATNEQTPPVFKAYFRQRLRWGTGHLQVMNKVRNHYSDSDRKKSLLRSLAIKGPIEWVFYQIISLIPVTVWFLFLLDIIKPEDGSWQIKLLLTLLSFIYFGFTFFCYYQYRQYIDMHAAPTDRVGKIAVMLGLLLLPLAALIFPLPFSSALVLKSLNKQPKYWVKTPRTQE